MDARSAVYGFALAIFVAVSLGCRPTVTFETEVKGSATVERSLLSFLDLPVLSGFSNIDFSQTQEFKNRGVRKEDVERVSLSRFTLRIAEPADGDFRWLKSMRFFAEASGRRELLAEKSGVSDLSLAKPNPSFDLDLRQRDIKYYVIAPQMSISSEGEATSPSQTTTLEATVVVLVEAYVIR